MCSLLWKHGDHALLTVPGVDLLALDEHRIGQVLRQTSSSAFMPYQVCHYFTNSLPCFLPRTI